MENFWNLLAGSVLIGLLVPLGLAGILWFAYVIFFKNYKEYTLQDNDPPAKPQLPEEETSVPKTLKWRSKSGRVLTAKVVGPAGPGLWYVQKRNHPNSAVFTVAYPN